MKINWQNHIETYDDYAFGRCFRFNSGKNITKHTIPIKNSKRSGWSSGFSIQFDSFTPYNYGTIYIYIHNHTMIPSTIYNKGIALYAGSDNHFVIKRVLNKKLPWPHSECLKDVNDFKFNRTIINFIQSKNWIYTNKECLRLCMNLMFNQTNECNFYLNELDEDFWYKYYDFQKDDRLKKCFLTNWTQISGLDSCSNKFCPLECDSISYETVLTSLSFPVGSPHLFKRFFAINVYYEDLSYTLIDQLPRTYIIDLISKIGGIFGVFLGFSFATFVEMFEFLVEILFIKFGNK